MTAGDRVSVIIPVYNAGSHICQAIDSVLMQTHDNIECIVINDGSTDGTHERLWRYGDRITYRLQANRGRSAARNVGISHATGEYIALLDADDYWAPNKLKDQIALLESKPSLGAVGCGAKLIEEDGTTVRELQAAPDARLLAGEEGFARLVTLDYGIAAPLSTLVIRRVCLESIGGFDETIDTMEEWDLLLRLIPDWDIGCVCKPLTFYRGYGFHVPRKVAPRKRQDKYIEVVNRAFSRTQDSTQDTALKNRALGLGYLRGALIDYAIGHLDKASKRLIFAWQLCPALFQGSDSKFVECTAYFAAYLYDTVTPMEESKAFVGLVFRNLPDQSHKLKAFESATLGLVFTIHAFDCYQRGDNKSVRAAIMKAWHSDPDMLKNRGLMSIFFESLIGHRPMRFLRKTVHRIVGQRESSAHNPVCSETGFNR